MAPELAPPWRGGAGEGLFIDRGGGLGRTPHPTESTNAMAFFIVVTERLTEQRIAHKER